MKFVRNILLATLVLLPSLTFQIEVSQAEDIEETKEEEFTFYRETAIVYNGATACTKIKALEDLNVARLKAIKTYEEKWGMKLEAKSVDLIDFNYIELKENQTNCVAKAIYGVELVKVKYLQ